METDKYSNNFDVNLAQVKKNSHSSTQATRVPCSS